VFTNTATISTVYSDTNPANNASAVGVTVANVAPVAAGDTYTVAPNTTLTVTAPGVLANDSDANNDALTASLVAGPLNGMLSLHADGSFTYTSPHGFVGLVAFT
jgi:Bacterial cadherin-like domain